MGDKGVHTFHKSISLKVNIIVQSKFELTYYDVVVQYVSHYRGLTLKLSDETEERKGVNKMKKRTCEKGEKKRKRGKDFFLKSGKGKQKTETK